MSEIFLIRHAQASFGAENYDQLSSLGHKQSQWLGEYLSEREVEFDCVMLGDMVRHKETLDGIRAGLQKHPQYLHLSEHLDQPFVMPALNEFDFMAIANSFMTRNPELVPDGRPTKSEYYQLFKKALYQWQEDGLGDDLPESFSEFSQRIRGFLDLMQSNYADRKILAISSGGAISRCLSQILKTPDASMIELNLQIRNSSITHCFFNEKSIRLHSFNEVPHLDSRELRQYITYS